MADPVVFKYGRRPPKRHPALKLGPLLTGIVPTHPDTVDYLAALSNWQILGNDSEGDCNAVAAANTRRLVTATLSTEYYWSRDQVLSFYKTQNPGFPAEDNGMDVQTGLETLARDGGPDGVKAVAFATVDYTNPDELRAAIAIFGSVWTGAQVQASNQAQFSQGQPWDYTPGEAIEGGHAIVVGGYSPNAADDERFITWGAETGFTDNFWSHSIDECWVVIWPEHLGSKAFQEGVDLGALAADYQALTGRTLPLPGGAPIPMPPVPTPTPAGCVVAALPVLALGALGYGVFAAFVFLPFQYFMVLLLAGFPVVVVGAAEMRK